MAAMASPAAHLSAYARILAATSRHVALVQSEAFPLGLTHPSARPGAPHMAEEAPALSIAVLSMIGMLSRKVAKRLGYPHLGARGKGRPQLGPAMPLGRRGSVTATDTGWWKSVASSMFQFVRQGLNDLLSLHPVHSRMDASAAADESPVSEKKAPTAPPVPPPRERFGRQSIAASQRTARFTHRSTSRTARGTSRVQEAAEPGKAREYVKAPPGGASLDVGNVAEGWHPTWSAQTWGVRARIRWCLRSCMAPGSGRLRQGDDVASRLRVCFDFAWWGSLQYVKVGCLCHVCFVLPQLVARWLRALSTSLMQVSRCTIPAVRAAHCHAMAVTGASDHR